MDKLKKELKMSLNSLNIVEEDPTILRGTCLVFDFEPNRHSLPSIITKEIAEENMKTLVGKRITCKYIKQEDNNGVDALGDHEENLEGLDRDGNEAYRRDTEAIGFIEDVFIDSFTDDEGNEKEGVFANIVIWNDDKYSDIVGLLKEWLDNDININMSCEYYYYNSRIENGVEYILSPIIFNAHTLLNSEDRGDYMLVEPAYKNSKLIGLNSLDKWNRAICQLNNLKNNKKEDFKKMENKILIGLNSLSFGNIEWELYYNELAKVMTAKEYKTVFMGKYSIYADYFVYDVYNEESKKYETYKVTYTVNEDDTISIDYEGRKQVEYELVEKETMASNNSLLKEANEKVESLSNDLEVSNNSLTEKENELKEAKEKINSLNEKIVALNNEKVTASNNAKSELENKVEELTAKINALQPLAEKYNEQQFNERLNSAKESFKDSFTKANAIDIFEEESTQELIKEFASADENISINAKNKLNSLIVESLSNVEIKQEPKDEDDIMQNNERISINSVQKSEDNEELMDDRENDPYARMGI